VDSGIRVRPLESQVKERLVNFRVPLTRRLLQTINGLLKKTDIVLLARYNPSLRLFHVDFLL
ncbi:hypothetical protein GY45DRAFT_1264940, partial [Cubamyces sp. BRFM 1775]